MVAKFIALFLIAAVVTKGHALQEIVLEDEYATFVTNPLIPKTLTIPKWFFDTLETCHVIFPNSVMYEAYPNNNLPQNGYILFLDAVQPFVSCGIGFIGAPVSASGTYQLVSVVQHTSDNSRTLTRQNFHLTLVESDTN